jgi:hypothetical protein
MPLNDTLTPPNALLAIPLDEDGVGQWRSRLDQAKVVNNQYHTEWDQAIKAYEGKPLAGEWPDAVNVNKHFSTVRLKSAQLFFRTGEVQASALRPASATPNVVPLAQAVINSKLGVHDINAKQMTRKVLTHLELCGVGPSKIGYEVFTRTVEMPVVAPEVSAMLAPEQQAQIPTQPVEQPVSERWFWEDFSAKRLLVPAEFEGPDFDKAPWLGMRYHLDPVVARRKFNLPEDFVGVGEKGEDRMSTEKASGSPDQRAECTEIWYYAARFDPAEPNPEVVRVLTFIEGAEEPVVEHRLSPYQTIGPDGALTADSMRGFPIHPLAINYVPDRAYPPSDATMLMPQVLELCKFRSQMMRQRDTSVPMRWYDKSRVPAESLEQFERGIFQGVVGLDGPADGQIGEISRAQYPRENFTAQQVIERDLEQTLAIGSNQRGTATDTERTATELQIVQNNTDLRMDDERNAVIDWYVRGVTKLWTLIQRFADAPDYVAVLGPDGANQLMPWSKSDIQGRFAFSLKTDSTVRPDSAMDQKRSLDLYNFMAKDPQVNRSALLQDIFAKFNLDPAKLSAQPQPPPPDKPNVSYRFSGADLDPALPQFGIVVSILEQGGTKIDPALIESAKQRAGAQIMAQAGMPGQPPTASMPPGRPGPPPNLAHGGMADKGELLNKHQEQQTGGMPGVKKPV